LPPMSVLAPADASVKPNADPIDGETWAAVKAKDSLAKGQCEHCGGHLEFSKEMEGTNVTCPHCNKSIKLAQSLVSASTDSQSKKKSLPVGIAVVRQVQRSACGPPAGPAQAKASPASPPAEVRSLSVGPSAVSVFPADAPPTASPPGSSPTIGQPKAGPKLETELRELVYLKDLKLITEKDYEEKKRKLLGLD